MAALNVKVEDRGPCRKILRIEVPAGIVSEEYGRVVEAFSRAARVDGFRPGRAPRAIVERRFAKEILEETKDQVLPRSYQAALKQAGLEPVAVVGMSEVELLKDQPLVFEVTVDVPPAFDLPDYRGIPVKDQKPALTEARVDEAIGRLRERRARFEDCADGVALEGDLVRLDYTGTCDGRPISEVDGAAEVLAQAKDFWVPLGDPREVVPGMSARLKGGRVGETREVAVTFPAEFPIAALAGRAAVYQVTIKAVRRRVLPEWDEAFLQSVGAASVEELREHVRRGLAEADETLERRRREGEIIQWLLEHTRIEALPPSVVEEETRAAIRDIVYENARRGVPREKIEESRDDIFEAATKSSADRLRLMYILRRIAAAEGITATDGDLERHIEGLAMRAGMTPERLRGELERREGALEDLRREARARKTLQWLLDAARVEASPAGVKEEEKA